MTITEKNSDLVPPTNERSGRAGRPRQPLRPPMVVITTQVESGENPMVIDLPAPRRPAPTRSRSAERQSSEFEGPYRGRTLHNS